MPKRKQPKHITYKISISCEIDEYGNVIPTGSNSCIESDKKDKLNMAEYPEEYKIVLMWLGTSLKYPKIWHKEKFCKECGQEPKRELCGGLCETCTDNVRHL